MLRGLLHPSEYKKILFQVYQQPKVTYGTEKTKYSIAREAEANRMNELKEKIKAKKLSSQKSGIIAKVTKATDVIMTVNLLTNTGKGTKNAVPDDADTNAVKKDEKRSNFGGRQHRSSSVVRLRRAKNVVSAVSAFRDGLKPGKLYHRPKNDTSSSRSCVFINSGNYAKCC